MSSSRGGSRVLVTAMSIALVAILFTAAAVAVKLLGGSDSPQTATASVKTPVSSAERRKERRDAQAEEIATDMRKVFSQIDQGHWQGTLPYLAAQEVSDLEQSGEASAIFQSAYTPNDLVGKINVKRISVARIQISGNEAEFLLTVPRDGGGCFKGVTWAERERGHWRYDPSTYNRPDRTSGRQGMHNRSRGC